MREKGDGHDGGGGEGRPGLPLGGSPRGAERRPGGARAPQQRLGGAPVAVVGGEGSSSRQQGRLLAAAFGLRGGISCTQSRILE